MRCRVDLPANLLRGPAVILNQCALFAVARVSFDDSPQVTANAVIGGDCVSTKKYFD